MTAHDNIDNLLAADLHGELSQTERSELHAHLLDCAICRQAHQETKVMNQLLEEKLEKPDPAFEQRMLGAFRNRVPEKSRSITKFVADLMRLRSAQIAGVAAVLLALVQVGNWLSRGGEFLGNEELPIPRAGSFEEFRMKLAGLDPKRMREDQERARAKAERVIATGSNIPTAEEVAPSSRLAAQAGSNDARFSESLNPPSPAASPLDKSQYYGGYAVGGQFADHGLLKDEKRKEQDAISNFASLAAAPAESSVVRKGSLQGAEAPAKSVTESSSAPPAVVDQQKLIRNAKIDLEIASFEDAVTKITAFANEERGYVATNGSQKQANGKLRGEIVVKVLPENLDRFLQKVRGLGELKNQTLGTEDVTKAYFDTEARLKNSRVMEQRLIDMLKTKTGKVSDLLEVERELARVREGIEKMQGELKYWDSQVQFATVTISLAEKDLEEPAAFLLKERAQLSLYATDVEKIYDDIKGLASPKVQITNAQLDRDNSGRVAAHLSMLIAPEESDGVIAKTKSLGRVENFQMQTQRIAQGGNGLSENAKTKRDKVELNITISREADEQAIQETSLRILSSNVDQNAARLKDETTKSGAEVRSSTFSRDPDGREVANISIRVAMKNYPALMKSLNQLGEVKDVSVQRHDKIDKNGSEENAPADLSIQIYSQGNIVSSDTGIFATLRNTIGQGAGALMWSLRMIGVAIAFLAPWVIALVALIWIVRLIARARRSRKL